MTTHTIKIPVPVPGNTTVADLTRAIVRPVITLGFGAFFFYTYVDGGAEALTALPAYITGLGVGIILSWFSTRPSEKLYAKVEEAVARKIS